MKEEDMEKYISNFSPELQEKARACKNIDEFKTFISKNNIELSEDALEAVSGGGDTEDDELESETPVRLHSCSCPHCGRVLQMVVQPVSSVGVIPSKFPGHSGPHRRKQHFICINPSCLACKGKWKFGRFHGGIKRL